MHAEWTSFPVAASGRAAGGRLPVSRPRRNWLVVVFQPIDAADAPEQLEQQR